MEKPTGLQEKKLPLDLTSMEMVFLIDQVKNTDIAEGLPDKEAYNPLARELLLRLGSMYVEFMTPTGLKVGSESIHLSEDEAWLLRSKTHTGDLGMDKQDVGTPLLLKLYALLLEFHTAPDFDLIVPMGDKLWKDIMGTDNGNAYMDAIYMNGSQDTPYVRPEVTNG